MTPENELLKQLAIQQYNLTNALAQQKEAIDLQRILTDQLQFKINSLEVQTTNILIIFTLLLLLFIMIVYIMLKQRRMRSYE